MNLNQHRFTRKVPFVAVLAAMLLLAACAEDTAEPTTDPEETVVTSEGVADVKYFSDWDLDDDTYLTEAEFASGVETLTLWEDWDTDADTYLRDEEFETAFGTYPWYTPTIYQDWDADADELLTEEEWRTGLFGTWDVNDDHYIGETEFDVDVLD